jgi:DNA-binding CsgD family transcriptional regulator
MDLFDLSTVSADDALRAAFLRALCERLELDHASYGMVDALSGKALGYSTYPDDWKKRYAELGLVSKDPTILVAMRSIAPVDWYRLSGRPDFDDVFSHARDFGIPSNGLSVPVRGPLGECGLLTVSRSAPQAQWELLKRQITGELQEAAVHFHDSVMASTTLGRYFHTPALSSREREILQWVAAGKAQQDVADILAIATRTVEVHLRSAREKLGALTTPQAVGRAIRLGFIEPR